ncbi:PEP-utilising enzyme, partial [Pristimantis euphronides]
MAVLLLLFLTFLILIKCIIIRVPIALSEKYPAPGGAWFCIKRFIYLMLIRYSPRKQTSYGALKEQEVCGKNKPDNQSGSQQRSTRDLESPQKLDDNLHAIDSVYFTAFREVDKSFIITRVARRPRNRCEVWLFMRVDGAGDFQHYEHPTTIMATEANNSWSAGGLTITCVQPYQTWRITFDGFLRKQPFQYDNSEGDGKRVYVKFTMLWTATTEVFDFDYNIHPGSVAHAMALEPISWEFLSAVKKSRDEHYRYEQWGCLEAEVLIFGEAERCMTLRGVRSHSYGVRNWADFHRYVMFLMRFENGASVHLNIVSLSKTTRHFLVGYMIFPDGKKAGIEWSDAHLSNLADDRDIKENYQICFTAGGQSFTVNATLPYKSRPLIHNPSLTSCTKSIVGTTYECIATFRTATGDEGWGLVEFFYE